MPADVPFAGAAAEDKYRSLLDSLDEAFCVVQLLFDGANKAVDYCYLEVNRVFEQQTGIRGAPGRSIRELVPSVEAAWLEIVGRVAVTGEPTRVENRSESLGRWFDVYAFRVGPPDARQVAMLFRDVTDRKRRESHVAFLGELSEQLSALVSTNDIMQAAGSKLGAYLDLTNLNLGDVDELEGTLRVVYTWGRGDVPELTQTFRTSDYLTEELMRSGRAGEMFVITDTRTVPHVGARAYEELKIGSCLVVPFHESGRWRSLLSACTAEPREWKKDELELFGEVANRLFPRLARARTEEALRRSEERFRRALSIETVGVLYFSLDGRLLDANRALERMSGYSREQLRSLGDWKVLTPREFMERTLRAAGDLATRGETAPYEKQWIRPDGSRWWGLFAPARLSVPGESDECVEFIIDISARMQAEAALRETALLRDHFVGILGHDLRNPLAATRAGLDLLLTQPLAEKQAKIVRRIAASTDRMVRMIGDLLDFTQGRLGGGIPVKPRPTNLHDVVRQTVEELQLAHQARSFELVADGDGSGEWDPDRLTQVVSNLIGNALQHGCEDSPVRVTARGDGTSVLLEVHNQGQPIPEHLLPVIFEPFRGTTPGQRRFGGQSLGLGLWIAHEIVRAHGGTIDVRSTEGEGTTFTVRLPRQSREAG